ncbi:hypothetical protein Tco_0153420 [Tanacetum coccineum]
MVHNILIRQKLIDINFNRIDPKLIPEEVIDLGRMESTILERLNIPDQTKRIKGFNNARQYKRREVYKEYPE